MLSVARLRSSGIAQCTEKPSAASTIAEMAPGCSVSSSAAAARSDRYLSRSTTPAGASSANSMPISRLYSTCETSCRHCSALQCGISSLPRDARPCKHASMMPRLDDPARGLDHLRSVLRDVRPEFARRNLDATLASRARREPIDPAREMLEPLDRDAGPLV